MGKEKGYVLYDEVSEVLPGDLAGGSDIDDVLAGLDVAGIEILEEPKDFEKKIEEYQEFVQKAEKEMQSLQEELTRKLYQQIEQAAGDYGKASGFTAICVKKDLLYLGGGVEVEDVTEALLKLVNEKEQKKISGK